MTIHTTIESPASARAVTTAKLAEIIRPFVGAKAFPARDPASKYGGYLPRKAAIDIRWSAVESRDADVRSVSDAGVEVFFYDRCDLIPWEAIYSITLSALDANGNRTSTRTVEHHPLQSLAVRAIGRAA